MSFFKSFFEWWDNRQEKLAEKEHAPQHRFDDLLIDLKSQAESQEPYYRRKAPLNPQHYDNLVKYVQEYFNQQQIFSDVDQNLKEALNIALSAHFLSDEQRASSIISLIGEKEALLSVRALRWKDGIFCPACGSSKIKKIVNTNNHLQKYICLSCQDSGHSGEFNDLTDYFEDYGMSSIRLWILIAYLRSFLPISKVAKVLGMTLEQTLHLIDLMNPKENHANLAKKARRSDSYFS